MHLVGQYLNPSLPLKTVLDWVPDTSLGSGRRGKRYIARGVPYRGRLGNGVVQAAVRKVLASADGPMRLSEIHTSVEHVLGRPLSIESVSWVLRKGVRVKQPQLERVRRGYYRALDAG